jgi:hypothetical protein
MVPIIDANLEIVRRLVATAASRDFPAALELLDPDVCGP